MTGLTGQGLASLPPGHGTRRGRLSPGLTVVATAVGILLLLPLVAVVVDASQAGWAEVSSVLFRSRSLALLVDTLALPLIVTPVAATIGTAAAWFTERTNLPGRRVWTVLLVLPIAMPDFIVGYAWHSIAPTADPLGAAVLVMTPRSRRRRAVSG
jgi:iron(III) transport system permease protein